MVTTYIVLTTGDPGVREALMGVCVRVGTPGPLGKVYIVESYEAMQVLEDVEGVVQVEEDAQIEPDPDDSGFTTQAGPENWFLNALSSDTEYYRYSRTGQGVDLYIVDSGIWHHHDEFENRVVHLWSFDGKHYGEGVKSPQHGTMVAGCAGGKQYGVAKQVMLVSARIDWSRSNTIKALDVILKDHLEKPNTQGSVLSMSFSTSSSIAFRYAIEALIDAGIVCMASTGNNATNVVEFPAGNDIVLGVGCLGHGYGSVLALGPAPYTNYGPGTDLWAPGHEGVVAGYTHHGTMRASGTSAACPVAAGIMAMYLEGSQKLTSRSDVEAALDGFMQYCTTEVEFPAPYYKGATVSSIWGAPVVKPWSDEVAQSPEETDQKKEWYETAWVWVAVVAVVGFILLS